MVDAAGFGWIEVGRLSVRSSGVRPPGISQGKIVDCRGSLGVGLVGNVGYSVGSNYNQK
jgi:hypothetical protein